MERAMKKEITLGMKVSVCYTTGQEFSILKEIVWSKITLGNHSTPSYCRLGAM